MNNLTYRPISKIFRRGFLTFLYLVTLGTGLTLSDTAYGADFTWNGDQSPDLSVSVPGNWNGDVAPPNDGSAVLDFTGNITHPTLPGDYSIDGLVFGPAAGSFTINYGGSDSTSLTIGAGGLAQDSNSNQTINATVDVVTSTDESSTWSATSATTSLKITGGLAVDGQNGELLLTSGIVYAPSVTVGRFDSGVSLVQEGGTLAIGGALELGQENGADGSYFLNGGTLNVAEVEQGAGAGDFIFNGGTLQANTSTVTFMQGLTQANVLAGAIIDTNGNNVTITQALQHYSGLGTNLDEGLTKKGSGTLTLIGANTYNGGTTIDADSGTLQLGDGTTGHNGSLGTGEVEIGADSTLALDQDATNNTVGTIANVITGKGNVTDISGGTTILTGANTYSGGTTISGGLIQLGDGVSANGTLGTGQVLDNGYLVFDPYANSTLTITNNLSGTGSLSQIGTGTTVISGTNDLTSTMISAGTLEVATASNLGLNTTLQMSGGELLVSSTANFSNAIEIRRRIGSNPPATELAALEDVTATFGGTISGTGPLTIGDDRNDGTIVLSGDNTYTGGTSLVFQTLEVSSDANLGAASGGITFDGGNLVTTANFTTSRTISLAAGGIEVLSPDLGTTATYNGVISGSSSNALAIGAYAAAGTVVLTADNTYSGGTYVLGGTLQIASQSNLGTGGITLGVGELLTSDTTTISQNVVIENGSANSGAPAPHLAAATGTSGIYSGVISSGPDTVGNVAFGDTTGLDNGLIDLSNTNTYVGGTEVVSGTVVATGTQSLSTGQVMVDTGAVVSLEGTTSVPGGVDVEGGSFYTFNSSSTFGSGVVINGGGSFVQAEGGVTINGDLVINNGTYNNEAISATQVSNLTVGASGVITGNAGALYKIMNNVSNSSPTGFDLANDQVELSGSSGTQHTFTWSVNSGKIDLGTFTIDSGQKVDFENGGNNNAALTVGNFDLADAFTLGASNSSAVQAAIGQALSGNLNIYYDPSDTDNAYLADMTYDFGEGGMLQPIGVPEPSPLSLLLFGAMGHFGWRRLRQVCSLSS